MKLKRYAAALLAAASLAGPVYAAQPHQQETQQEAQQEQPQQQNDAATDTAFSAVGVSTAQCDSDCTPSTASLNIFEFPESELWLVGGHSYDGAHSADAGVKYVWGKRLRNLARFTLDADGGRASAGFDAAVRVASYKGADLQLIGDLSTVDAGERRTDFGAGANVAAGDHNAFFLYSNRGDVSAYRAGYMLWSDERLAALTVDYDGALTPTLYYADGSRRLWASYNNSALSTENILVFGSNPMPPYAMRGFLATQNILTRRSVQDSDFTQFFQPTFFLAPERVSDVLRFLGTYDFGEGFRDALVYNALGVRTQGDQALILTQNLALRNDRVLAGAGIGYDFGSRAYHLAPVLRYQAGGGDSLWAVDFSWKP